MEEVETKITDAKSATEYLLKQLNMGPDIQGSGEENSVTELEKDDKGDFYTIRLVSLELKNNGGSGTMTPKACTRKVLSVFEHQTAEINKISKLINETCKSMKEAYEATPELLEYSITLKEKYKSFWSKVPPGIIKFRSGSRLFSILSI